MRILQTGVVVRAGLLFGLPVVVDSAGERNRHSDYYRNRRNDPGTFRIISGALWVSAWSGTYLVRPDKGNLEYVNT